MVEDWEKRGDGYLTSKLIEFERKGDGEEEELVGNGDEEGDGEIIVIQSVDLRHIMRFELSSECSITYKGKAFSILWT